MPPGRDDGADPVAGFVDQFFGASPEFMRTARVAEFDFRALSNRRLNLRSDRGRRVAIEINGHEFGMPNV
jgi:hypothetical protein